jgi:hypothetical protein
VTPRKLAPLERGRNRGQLVEPRGDPGETLELARRHPEPLLRIVPDPAEPEPLVSDDPAERHAEPPELTPLSRLAAEEPRELRIDHASTCPARRGKLDQPQARRGRRGLRRSENCPCTGEKIVPGLAGTPRSHEANV